MTSIDVTARIRQLNLAYVPLQDRILLRVNTNENTEFRMWFTRNFIRILWPELVNLLAADPQIQVQTNDHNKKAVLSFKHEQAVSQSNFSKKYNEEVNVRPLGSVPLLVSALKIKPGRGGSSVMVFQSPRSQGIELVMDQDLLHSFCKLLQDTVNKADWDLHLSLGQTWEQEVGETHRVLN